MMMNVGMQSVVIVNVVAPKRGRKKVAAFLLFHSFVDQKKCGNSFSSLDEAVRVSRSLLS
jgi:hypothetical protein